MKKEKQIDLDPNSYLQEFYVCLSNNPNLVPYLTIDFSSCVSEDFVQKMGDLTNFYHFQVLAATPRLDDVSQDLIYLYSSDNRKIHTIKFLSHKVFKQKHKKHEAQKNTFSQIIGFLEPFYQKFSHNPIIVDLPRLIDDYYTEGSSTIYLSKPKPEPHAYHPFPV